MKGKADMIGAVRRALRSTSFRYGLAVVLLGVAFRIIMSRVMFLQADEEIFSYDAWYFLLGRPLSFIIDKIGVYIGYPLALSVWFRIFGVSLLSARLFSVACYGGILSFTYIVIKRISGSDSAAFLGGMAVAVLPFPLRYGHIVLSEPFSWLFLTLSILMLVIGLRRNRWYHFALSGLFVVLAATGRRSALVLALVVVPLLIWINRGQIGRMLKQTLCWIGGFLVPLAAGFGGFVLYFGWSKLEEYRLLSLPDFSTGSTYENALYTLQPVLAKSTILALLLLFSCAAVLMSVFRNRWKVVFMGCVLWPALVRVAFSGNVGGSTITFISVLPILLLPFVMDDRRRTEVWIASSLLIGSSVAFSVSYLSGSIWNVVIYTSVGAMLLLFLEDRVSGRLTTPLLLLGGLALSCYVFVKEPQVADLVVSLLPLAGILFSIGAATVRRPSISISYYLLASFALILLLSGFDDPLVVIAGSSGILLSSLVLAASLRRAGWARLRMFMPLFALCFALLIPDTLPGWAVLLVLALALYLAFLSYRDLSGRSAAYLPAALAIIAAFIVYHDSGSFLHSGLSLVLVGAAASFAFVFTDVADRWGERVGESASLVLLAAVIGFIGFYVYYAWTEVYLSELIVPAGMMGGILLYALRGSLKRPGKKAAAVLAGFLVLSIPVSVGYLLESDWFVEEGMDKRPYMRTIQDIVGWIEDNTDGDEKVLAWHCYAIESERETIIGVSNAARYRGVDVMADMEEERVNVFVQCWYTNHGIWENQPVFQSYIRSNFHIDRVVDGNNCWLRSDPI